MAGRVLINWSTPEAQMIMLAVTFALDEMALDGEHRMTLSRAQARLAHRMEMTGDQPGISSPTPATPRSDV